MALSEEGTEGTILQWLESTSMLLTTEQRLAVYYYDEGQSVRKER